MTDSQCQQLPAELEGPLNSVVAHVRYIAYLWQTYKQLFAESSKRRNLPHAEAGDFFRLVDDVLLDAILLGMARLHDKAQEGGSRNLSLQYIIELIPNPAHAQLITELDTRRSSICSTCKTLTRYRHKRIGHNDHKLGKFTDQASLPDFSVDEVDHWLSLHQDWVDCVFREFSPGLTKCWSDGGFHGAESILYAMKCASAFKDLDYKEPMTALQLLKSNKWESA